jgi:hypothetical protein
VLSETGEGKVFEGHMEESAVLGSGIFPQPSEALQLKPYRSFASRSGESMVSVGWEIKWKSRLMLFPNGEMGKGPLAGTLSWSQP